MRLRNENPEQFIKLVADILHTFSVDSSDIAQGVEYILEQELWKHRNPAPGLLAPKEFESFPEFCEAPSPWGLRQPFPVVLAACKNSPEVYRKLLEAGNMDSPTLTKVKPGSVIHFIQTNFTQDEREEIAQAITQKAEAV